MKKAPKNHLTIVFAAVVALSLLSSAAGQSTVTVYILDPTNPANGTLGVSASGYLTATITVQAGCR